MSTPTDDVEGYVSPEGGSLYVKSGGQWHEFIAKTEALIYVRFKDYGAQGEELVFVTLDRQRAFEVQREDDIWEYDHLHIWRDGQCVQKWAWSPEQKWEWRWTDERAQEAGTEEADAESGSSTTEAYSDEQGREG